MVSAKSSPNWLIYELSFAWKFLSSFLSFFTQLVSRKNVYILYYLINKTNMDTALSTLQEATKSSPL